MDLIYLDSSYLIDTDPDANRRDRKELIMTIVPWATLNPTRDLAASALPSSPVVPEPEPTAAQRAWRRLVRHQH